MERWPDGSKFEGNYKQGVKQGHGKFTWADGNCYEGNFEVNNIQGKGKPAFILLWLELAPSLCF